MGSIYLVALPYLNRQKYNTHVVTLPEKNTIHKHINVATTKNSSLQCACYWYDLLLCFFISCDEWNTLLFTKVYSYSEIF